MKERGSKKQTVSRIDVKSRGTERQSGEQSVSQGEKTVSKGSSQGD